MSDELVKSLNQRIAELERRCAELGAEAKKHRLAHRETKAKYEALQAEHEQLMEDAAVLADAVENDPASADERVQELQAQLRQRDITDKFKDAGLADGIKAEQVLAFFGVDPKAVELESLPEQFKAWREAAPGLFKQADAAKAEAAPRGAQQGQGQGLDLSHLAGRGGRDTGSQAVTYTRAEVARAGWERSRPELAAALKDGTAQLVEG